MSELKPWSDMTPRERDALVGEVVMGQTDFEHIGFIWEEGTTEDGEDGWDGFYCPRCHAEGSRAAVRCARQYTTDIAKAQLVEDEIARRGLIEKYQNALIGLIDLDMQVFNSAIELDTHNPPDIPNNDFEWQGHAFLWRYSQATPEQRCHAACRAVGVEV